jgi:hypothetical protein
LADYGENTVQAAMAVSAAAANGARTRSWTAAATPRGVEPIADAVSTFAAGHCPRRLVRERIRPATVQALSLALFHARGAEDELPGTITVRTAVFDGTLSVNVSDDGTGQGPDADSLGLGVGLPAFTPLVDGLTVAASAEQAGTEIAMTFRLAPAAERVRA